MKREALTLLLICWLTVSTLTLAESTLLAKADPIPVESIQVQHGYIRSDGAIDPSNLPIQRSGNLYVLDDNLVNYSITILRSNITFDGNGFSMIDNPVGQQTPSKAPKTADPAIELSNLSDVTVENLTFKSNFSGGVEAIDVLYCSNITISQNILKGESLFVAFSANCNIIGNKITDDSAASITGSFINFQSNEVSADYYGASFIVSNSNITQNDVIDNSAAGLSLQVTSSNNVISQNNFVNNEVAIQCLTVEGLQSNQIVNNYWSNNKNNITNENGNKPIPAPIDQSPLTSPALTVFTEAIYTLPSLANSTNSTTSFTTIIAAASITASVIAIAGLILSVKKKRKLKPPSTHNLFHT